MGLGLPAQKRRYWGRGVVTFSPKGRTSPHQHALILHSLSMTWHANAFRSFGAVTLLRCAVCLRLTVLQSCVYCNAETCPGAYHISSNDAGPGTI